MSFSQTITRERIDLASLRNCTHRDLYDHYALPREIIQTLNKVQNLLVTRPQTFTGPYLMDSRVLRRPVSLSTGRRRSIWNHYARFDAGNQLAKPPGLQPGIANLKTITLRTCKTNRSSIPNHSWRKCISRYFVYVFDALNIASKAACDCIKILNSSKWWNVFLKHRPVCSVALVLIVFK